jgi:hypothetical protein
MKNKPILILLIFFFCLNTSSFALDEEGDKIIKKYFKAIGGIKNWEKIRTLKIVKHLKQSNDELTILFNTEIVRDKGMRIESTVNQGSPSVIGINNSEGWRVLNGFGFMSKEQMLKAMGTKSQIAAMPDSLFREYKFISGMPWNLIKYKEKGYRVGFKNTGYVDGEAVNEVELSLGERKVASCFFSARNNYLVKVNVGQREFVYSDYKIVENVKLPFTENETLPNKKTPFSSLPVHFDYVVDRITLNSIIYNENMEKPTN